MAEVLEFRPKHEKEKNLPDGTRIFIEYVDDPLDMEGGFSDVAEHEAEHAVVAIRNGTTVIEGSIIPDGPVKGYVQMGSTDVVAAATSHGRAGHAGDQAIVESQGLDFASVARTSHAILANNKPAVRAVAIAFEKERRLSGPRIKDIINKVDTGDRIRIRIVSPDGSQQVMTKRAKTGEVTTVEIPSKKRQVTGRPEQTMRHDDIATRDLPRSDIKTENDFRVAA